MTRTPSSGRQRPSSPFPAPALLGIGALLLCACPTRAQTLSVANNSSATVSGAGTAATGPFVAFGGGAGPGTSNYQTGTVFFGTLNLQDGGSFQSITVGQSGTANISGGTAGTVADQAGINSRFDSISISGGTVNTVTTDRGSVGISGGTVQNVGADTPDANQTGPIFISGGNIQNVNTPGGLGVSGGTLGTVSTSSATITGGTTQTLSIFGLSAGGAISGGTISTLNIAAGGTTKISGGSFQFITNSNFGPINILGTGLQEIGTPTDASNDGVFQLTGILSDGEILNAQYTQTKSGLGSSGTLEFNGVKATPTPVPEASTVVSLGGMLLLGGAGLAFRARKRARA